MGRQFTPRAQARGSSHAPSRSSRARERGAHRRIERRREAAQSTAATRRPRPSKFQQRVEERRWIGRPPRGEEAAGPTRPRRVDAEDFANHRHESASRHTRAATYRQTTSTSATRAARLKAGAPVRSSPSVSSLVSSTGIQALAGSAPATPLSSPRRVCAARASR